MGKKPKSKVKACAPKTKVPSNPGLYHVMLIDQTSPKFAHNAIQRGKTRRWTYEYWPVGTPSSIGAFYIDMDTDVYKNMNENTQSLNMNEEAKRAVSALASDCRTVKLVSRRR